MSLSSEPAAGQPAPVWHLYVPKLYTTLRQGYSIADLRQDAVAGLTVAIVALPLAMALAIASGATPDKGLLIAVIAGLARLGTWIKYTPEPVISGFTAGIAVIILSSQVRDFFGPSMAGVPADFFAKWAAFWDARGTSMPRSAWCSSYPANRRIPPGLADRMRKPNVEF